MERGPGKRKIKPSKISEFLNFDDICNESSSDSDFRIDDHGVNSESDSDDRGSHANDDCCSEEDTSDDDDDDGTVCNKSVAAGNSTSVETTSQETSKKVNIKEIVDKIRICNICLVEASSDDVNGLKDCDKCGISVHDGCYGKNDSESDSLSVSENLWLCDACKAGIENPTCELCPNLGGVFKETDRGKWVHLVCALYVPDIAFGEAASLTKIILFPNTIPRWGYKSCIFCEDSRFVHTGVTIACDAGMCRSNFHVTCAQREGSLSDAQSPETDQLDPFYAHCKLHVDKLLAKKKKKNWLALQLRTKQMKLLREEQFPEKSAAWQQNQQRLEQLRLNHYKMKRFNIPDLTHISKVPRYITTSTSSCQALWLKASLMGINMVSGETIEESITTLRDVPKKWHLPPAFSVEFVSYFSDRNLRIINYKNQSNQLIEQKNQLIDNLGTVQKKYDEIIKNNAAQKQKYLMLKHIVAAFQDVISIGNPDTRLSDVDTLITNEGSNNHDNAPAAPNKFPTKRSNSVRIMDDEAPVFVYNKCGFCDRTNDQHLLAKCDKCRLYYHIGCLKPPLTRIPKKTKSYGWQCCKCDKNDSDSEPETVDPNAPRQLRRKTRNWFLSWSSDDANDIYCSTDQSTSQSLGIRKRKKYEQTENRCSPEIVVKTQVKSRKRKRHQKNSTLVVKPASGLSKEPTQQVSKIIIDSVPCASGVKTISSQLLSSLPVDGITQAPLKTIPKKRSVTSLKISTKLKDINVTHKCFICNTSATRSTVAQCDKCDKNYHLSCLDPPLKKSPKVYGYSWHCAECDSTESDSLS